MLFLKQHEKSKMLRPSQIILLFSVHVLVFDHHYTVCMS